MLAGKLLGDAELLKIGKHGLEQLRSSRFFSFFVDLISDFIILYQSLSYNFTILAFNMVKLSSVLVSFTSQGFASDVLKHVRHRNQMKLSQANQFNVGRAGLALGGISRRCTMCLQSKVMPSQCDNTNRRRRFSASFDHWG